MQPLVIADNTPSIVGSIAVIFSISSVVRASGKLDVTAALMKSYFLGMDIAELLWGELCVSWEKICCVGCTQISSWRSRWHWPAINAFDLDDIVPWHWPASY